MTLPTALDLPVKRRSGFRPPPSALIQPPIEPLDRVLPPTGPVSLPEATASLLDEMITGSIPVVGHPTQPSARHAAPPSPPTPHEEAVPPAERLAGPVDGRDGLYDDWEQSLRSIGRPRAAWEDDVEIVPTGGDADLPTMALPVQWTGPQPWTAPQAQDLAETVHRGAHALPDAPVAPADAPTLHPRRSGRRRAATPEDVVADRSVPQPTVPTVPPLAPVDGFVVPMVPPPARALDAPVAGGLFDLDEQPAPADRDEDTEGIDEIAVDYPVVSAATTGAVDLPQVEARPRTAPVLIERVRTALLQLPSVPPSPTGSGAGAIVGRWIGAFASPLVLVLAFGLAAAGSGPASVVAIVLGALLAVPALVRTASWSARTTDDAAMQETALLGARAGRGVATVLLLARLGAAATVLFGAGSAAGAWADRTGALGLGASSAALLGSTAVALLAILCAALPTRATAVLTLLVAVLGAVGTLLVALVLAPNGGTAVATTSSGAVAAAVAGFAGVGLLLVLCGADIARWRTDLAHPVSTAVAATVSVLGGAGVVAGATLIASRLAGGGDPVDGFAGALSDASASLLAAPMLIILLVSAVTLPAILLRSAGSSAARLLGAGRPVRLGAVASGLIALSGALGMLAAGTDPTAEVLAAAALCGAPVAAWAGLLMTSGSRRRSVATTVGFAVATVVGWALSDGLVPGAVSPVLAALPAASGLHGGPALGLAAALVLGAIAGLLGSRPAAERRAAAGPADTVEG